MSSACSAASCYQRGGPSLQDQPLFPLSSSRNRPLLRFGNHGEATSEVRVKLKPEHSQGMALACPSTESCCGQLEPAGGENETCPLHGGEAANSKASGILLSSARAALGTLLASVLAYPPLCACLVHSVLCLSIAFLIIDPVIMGGP